MYAKIYNKQKRRIRKKKRRKGKCIFCKQGFKPNYKDIETLSRFVTDRGRIKSKVHMDVCHKDQRKLARAIKRARFLALLPFLVKPS